MKNKIGAKNGAKIDEKIGAKIDEKNRGKNKIGDT